jgi:hypothetical protein
MEFRFTPVPLGAPVVPETPDAIRKRGARARDLAACAFDAQTIEMLNQEAADLDDMAEAEERRISSAPEEGEIAGSGNVSFDTAAILPE